MIGLEKVHLAVSPVDSVTRQTGHRITGAGISGLLSKRVPHTVLVGVTGTAELHRVVGKEQRLLTAMGPMTGRTIETLMTQIPSLRPRLGTSRVVALGTDSLRILTKQSCAVTGMRIVAGHAITASRRDMAEG